MLSLRCFYPSQAGGCYILSVGRPIRLRPRHFYTAVQRASFQVENADWPRIVHFSLSSAYLATIFVFRQATIGRKKTTMCSHFQQSMLGGSTKIGLVSNMRKEVLAMSLPLSKAIFPVLLQIYSSVILDGHRKLCLFHNFKRDF